jgi:hypothetical protein
MENNLPELKKLLEDFLNYLQDNELIISPDIALKIQNIFLINKIYTPDILKDNCFLIAPIICKNPKEQKHYYDIFPKYFTQEKLVEQKINPPNVILDEEVIIRYKKRLYLISIAVFIICSLIFLSHFNRIIDQSSTRSTDLIIDNSVEKNKQNIEQPTNALENQKRNIIDSNYKAIDYSPIKQMEVLVIIKPSYFYLIILPLLFTVFIIIIVILVWFKKYKKVTLEIIEKIFKPGPNLLPPFGIKPSYEEFNFTDEKQIRILAWKFNQLTQFESPTFKINETVNRTIQNAGFPEVVFGNQNVKPSYIVLLDITAGKKHFVHLIEELYKHLNSYNVVSNIFYYNQNPFVCYNDLYTTGISIEELHKKYSGSRLIIYSNGYSFLDSHSNNEFNLKVEKILYQWTQRALITNFPRECWGENESKIKDLIPIYSADIASHLRLAEAFYNKQHKYPIRSNRNFIPFPIESSLKDYSEFFEGDKIILEWLSVLALSEDITWEATIITGKTLGKQNSKSYLDFDRLLRMNRVKWLQDGDLRAKHREELIDRLLKDAKGQLLVNAANLSLRNHYENAYAPENSYASLDKKSKILALNYRLNKSDPQTKEITLALKEKGVLDSHTSNLITGDIKKNYNWDTIYAIIVLIIVTTFIFIIVPNNRKLEPPFQTFTDTSKSQYYNNLAVDIITKTPNFSSSDSLKTLNYLTKALNISLNNDTARLNYIITIYKIGLDYLNEGNYNLASKCFTDYIFSDDDFKLSNSNLKKEHFNIINSSLCNATYCYLMLNNNVKAIPMFYNIPSNNTDINYNYLKELVWMTEKKRYYNRSLPITKKSNSLQILNMQKK